MNILRHPIYNLANLLTSCNLLLGVWSIICSLNGRLDWACYALFFAIVCDFLDGFVARLFKVSGEFGKQLDSLADMVSFGVAPGAFMFVMVIVGIDSENWKHLDKMNASCQIEANQYVQLKIQQWSDAFFYRANDGFEMQNPCALTIYQNPYDASIKYLPFVALLIPLFSMLRLAKFNIDTNQNDSFIGIPTPMNTFFFMFFPIYFVLNFHTFHESSSFIFNLFDCYSLAILIVLVSPLMMAPIKLIALKFSSLKVYENLYRFILVGLSLISIPLFKLWSLPFILILYLGLSILQRILTVKK